MSKEEAMKLALEALKQIDEAMPFPVAKLAQAALREALAEQPAQQEPVGEAHQMSELVEGFTHCIWDERVIPVGTKLYTSPPAQRTWVGLTDEEFDDLRDNNLGISPLISAVEAKLKEKNT